MKEDCVKKHVRNNPLLNTKLCAKVNEKIILNDTSKGDSRTSGGSPTLEEVYEATMDHINDVDRAMQFWVTQIQDRKGFHDWTKINGFEDEYGYLVTNDIQDDEFFSSEWWYKHITKERHHLMDHVPADVNLIDVLEMISDRVTAEKGRRGSINTNYLKIDPDVLVRAFWNTVTILDQHTIKRGD